MKVVTREEINLLDRKAEELGLSEEILMENAGEAVFNFIKEKYSLDRHFLIFAGTGNNGGDAFVVARKLASHFAKVTLFLVGNTEKLKGISKRNFELLNLYPVEVLTFEGINRVLLESLTTADIVIDGVFGTGLQRAVEGKIKELFVEINNVKKTVVSIDIPSGIDANTGAICGEGIKANYTITMGLPKRGLFSYPGCDYAGKVIVSHISYPIELTLCKDIKVEISFIEPFEERPTDAHKGTSGKALFIAGSKNYFGAPYFNAMSFLKSGGGMSYLATTESVGRVVMGNAKELIIVPLKESANGTISKDNLNTLIGFAKNMDIISIGSGLSIDEDTESLFLTFIDKVQTPLIIDGDGLTILSKHRDILKEREAETILTPHIGEFSRLIDTPIEEIKKDRFSYLFKAMDMFKNSIIVLKGAYTLIGANGNIYINTSGNPVLATPGSGDVLVGTIASSITRKKNTLKGVVLGTYIHGLSGDLIQKEFNEGVTATDILENLKFAVRYYKEHFNDIKGGLYEGARNLRQA